MLTGDVRKGVMLLLYTSQRVSEMVRLGWTMVDGDGFDLDIGIRGQKKTEVRPWSPILPDAAKLATREKRPGPFVLNKHGRPYSAALFTNTFLDGVRRTNPVFADCTLHGLRATAVIMYKRRSLRHHDWRCRGHVRRDGGPHYSFRGQAEEWEGRTRHHAEHAKRAES
jgi:integrase